MSHGGTERSEKQAGLADEFAAIWDAARAVPDVFGFLAGHPDCTAAEKTAVLLVDQFRRWQIGRGLPVEEYFRRCPDVAADPDLKLELICEEFGYREQRGEKPQLEGFIARFPELGEQLTAALGQSGRAVRTQAEMTGSGTDLSTGGDTRQQPEAAAPPDVDAIGASADPEHIGRYRVVRVLGRGEFGQVYLARDEELERYVAIKVPHRSRVRTPTDLERFVTEARLLAGLDHPAVVPVHDVGHTADGLCYVVSKYIEGTDLAARIRSGPMDERQALAIVARVAEALHEAHRHGLVHRDVKPANILLDADGKPYVTDFGLALTEDDFGRGPGFAGTPAYMSPEQARGEGHLVDGRSDIFSLGVVLYELLTGQRPFRGADWRELSERIRTLDARPPRQLNDAVSREAERICLKALSKRATDRYTTALDMAEDLRHCLERLAVRGSGWSGGSTGSTDSLGKQTVRIVPKGLRSFDASDADFFLELLPGPRDRHGLPESLRFWKSRIEETDADRTCRVGLIYGPSGCGKTSLVRAGLLPRLESHVSVVYVEASAAETESRILAGIRKRCPHVDSELGLTATLSALRRGQGLAAGRKLLFVIDQFEQWLHAQQPGTQTELVESLRQCDGGRVQCLLMVRDDFWLAVSRFMREIEVRIVEGRNSTLVDLFDTRHARKVLEAFGRAFGAIPESASDRPRELDAFLDQAVAELAEDGKVVCVRLALFAEMMKGRPWTPATLRQVGGARGLGVTFLEETFASSTAPPEHRYHQAAARAVLEALLPDERTDIRSRICSEAELLTASGYARRPEDFAVLMQILDSEMRLLTPVDPQGMGESETVPARPGERFYQLTHDYLVPAIREWLVSKQRETRRGRAELILEERAAFWRAKPETRHLPSLWETLRIRLLTDRKRWNATERRMMRAAARHHLGRTALFLLLLIVIIWAGFQTFGQWQAQDLVHRLLVADTAEVPALVRQIDAYRRWCNPLLREALDNAAQAGDDRRRLHASLALLPVDRRQVDYLYERLLAAQPREVAIIVDALRPYREQLHERLLRDAHSPEKPQHVLRTAAALASFAPDRHDWNTLAPRVADQLVTENLLVLEYWLDALRPVRQVLIEPLTEIFRDVERSPFERSLATHVLADYASTDIALLVELLKDAEPESFAVLFPVIARHGGTAIRLLRAELDEAIPPIYLEEDQDELARRHANAAVALLRMGARDAVWPLLSDRGDVRLQSFLIDRLAPLGADPQWLANRLEDEADASVRRSLLVALAAYHEDRLPAGLKDQVVEAVLPLYRSAPDAGLHGAIEHLLRRWGLDERLQAERAALAAQKVSDAQWYVNALGQTFVIFAGPQEFEMGSPPTDVDWQPDELQHRRRIDRTFAIAATEVTVADFQRFLQDHPELRHSYLKRFAPQSDCPQVAVTWYEAAAYCRWLSEQENVPADQMCYPPIPEIGPGMKLPADFLSRSGYRLPTEAEWECACRAGTPTRRYYGSADELLRRHAWYQVNARDRTWPVGLTRPNRMGLLDVYGNVWEWCHDRYAPYPSSEKPLAEVFADVGDAGPIADDEGRVLRGGSFVNLPRNVRSAFRNWNLPNIRDKDVGFRPARTLPTEMERSANRGGSTAIPLSREP